MNFSQKMYNEENAFEVCYVYTSNASITQEMRFLYINGFILESCKESLIICLQCQQLKIH